MLSRDEIQTALGADRVIPLNIKNPHGPLGLEQLTASIQRMDPLSTESNQIQRSISLPLETWDKLHDLAQQLSQLSPTRPVTASDVARSLVVEGIGNASQS
jgi:hypothetical protein